MLCEVMISVQSLSHQQSITAKNKSKLETNCFVSNKLNWKDIQLRQWDSRMFSKAKSSTPYSSQQTIL